MPEHELLIQRFYEAFGRRDHATMAACYADDARFSDPVFPTLRGPEIGGMWRMLCLRATDLRISCRDVTASDDRGSAHWEAWYTYSATGRQVHNVIEARFRFQDGRVTEHVDRFDLYRWSRMALGAKGMLLGWTPLVQGMIRRQADSALRRFLERERAGSSA